MPDTPPASEDDRFAALLGRLIACPEEQFALWIQENPAARSLSFLQYIKDTGVSTSHVLSDPNGMDLLTRRVLSLAGFTAYAEPRGLAIAQWMRGLWAMQNDVAAAAVWFRSALPAYEAIGDHLSVARLNSNLVGVLAAIGRNQEAEACYQQARPRFVEMADREPKYLVYLEQNFGWLLHTWGRNEEALVVHQRALALAVQHNLTISVAEIQVNLCLTLARLGRIGEVEQMLLRERAVALTAGERVTVARIDMNLGDLYTVLGRPADALRRLKQAAQGFVDMEQGAVLAREAVLLREIGAPHAALRQFEAALRSFERYELQPSYAEAMVNLASTLRVLGGRKRLKRAEELLDRAHTLWQALGSSNRLAHVVSEQVRVAGAQGDFERALVLLAQYQPASHESRLRAEHHLLHAEIRSMMDMASDREAVAQSYRDALEFAERQGMRRMQRQALHGLGRLLLGADWVSARSCLEAAAAIDDEVRQMLTTQELKAGFHEQANDLYDDLIAEAVQHAEFERALAYVWRSKASAFLELAQSLRDDAGAASEEREGVNVIRQQIAARRWALARDSELGSAAGHDEAADTELTALTEQLLTARRSMHRHDAGSAFAVSEQGVCDALAAMPEEALIEFVRCGDTLFGLLATREGVKAAVRLCDVAAVAELAGRLSLAFHSFNALATSSRSAVVEQRVIECQPLLRRCYDLLLAPFAAYLQQIPQNGRILIAPCDTVSMLPFAAFWNGERYLVESVEIELVQSGAVLHLPLPTAREYSPSVAVAAAAGAVTSVRDEAAAVAACIGSCDLFVDRPVLEHLDVLAAPPRILHIAAHTIHRGDAPFFSGIQLHGEVLSVEHCYDLPLRGSELVTLSGCSTAAGMESDASLFAFQSACLLAGAQRVLCSLWPVADGIPGPMMAHFYRLLCLGSSVPAALRRTQLHFLSNGDNRHPALWAAFTSIRR